MRKNLGPLSLLYPEPVLIIATYNEDMTGNAMNAAWGGICGTARISICLDKDHKTVKNLLRTKAFTVSIGDVSHMEACDYLGLESGNKVTNKLERAHLSIVPSEYVDAPIIKELPLALECKVISYDEEAELLIGEIVNVSADDSILNERGKIDVTKLDPIMYDSAGLSYRKIGEKVGNAFKDGAKFKE